MLVHWIWLAHLRDLSLMQKHRLLERFPDPQELFCLNGETLQSLGIRDTDLSAAEQIQRRCVKKNIGILPITDEAYPSRLRNTSDAPIILYYRGILPDWDGVPFIGVVGTRKASAYGLQVAHQMGSQISRCGGMVVSGGASGIDTASMQGALDAGCPVIGVLGCGVDVAYPRHNRKLFETVVISGCLISEYPPGDQGKPWHFPARNRIISGVSNGILVVEAPKKSGALISANHALEQGRDVFVVPGNINTLTCEGSNALLQDGAIPVLSGWDVLREYDFLYPGKLSKAGKALIYDAEKPLQKVAQPASVPEQEDSKIRQVQKKDIDNRDNSPYIELENTRPALNQEEQAVLALLTRQPQEPAELMAKLDMPSGKVLSTLTMLAVKGLVYKHPGGRVSLK